MHIRTDRLGVLIDQLADSATFSRDRIHGLTDTEYLWEPTAGAWSLRHRGTETTPHGYGAGDIVIDHDTALDPFEPGPVTTIAWRIAHLTDAYAGRYEWTFGPRATDPRQITRFTLDASQALENLWHEIDRWSAALEDLADQQLDEPGFGQYPYGLDPHIPFIGIIRWMNRETIHHLAEVALLRDLHAAGQSESAHRV